MSPLYVFALLLGLVVIVYEWRRHQEEFQDIEFTDPEKLKNEASFRSRFLRFFAPSQRTQYFYDDRPWWQQGMFRVLKVVYIIFVVFALLVALVPVVQWVYHVPPEFEGSLSEFSPAASETLGSIFFICLVIAVAFLRRWPWRVWNALLAFSVVFFFVMMILYENLY